MSSRRLRSFLILYYETQYKIFRLSVLIFNYSMAKFVVIQERIKLKSFFNSVVSFILLFNYILKTALTLLYSCCVRGYKYLYLNFELNFTETFKEKIVFPGKKISFKVLRWNILEYSLSENHYHTIINYIERAKLFGRLKNITLKVFSFGNIIFL